MYNRLLNAREARRNEDGFTLIELLIVIVVLGILAGIVVFGVGTFRADSQAAADDADCKTVSVASEAFAAAPTNTTGAYPTTMGQLVPEYIKTHPGTTTDATPITSTGMPAGC